MKFVLFFFLNPPTLFFFHRLKTFSFDPIEWVSERGRGECERKKNVYNNKAMKKNFQDLKTLRREREKKKFNFCAFLFSLIYWLKTSGSLLSFRDVGNLLALNCCIFEDNKNSFMTAWTHVVDDDFSIV